MGAPCSCPVRNLPMTVETESITSNASPPPTKDAFQRRKQSLGTRRSDNRVSPLPSISKTLTKDTTTLHNGISTICLGNDEDDDSDSLSADPTPHDPSYAQKFIQNRANGIRGQKLVKQIQVESFSGNKRTSHAPELSDRLASPSDHNNHRLSSRGGYSSWKDAGLGNWSVKPIDQGTNPPDIPGNMIDLHPNLDQVNVNLLVVNFNNRVQRYKQARLQRQSTVKSDFSENASPKFSVGKSRQDLPKPKPPNVIPLKDQISLGKNNVTNFLKDMKPLALRRWSSSSGKDVPPAVSPQPHLRENLLSRDAYQNEQMSILHLGALPLLLPAAMELSNSRESKKSLQQDSHSTALSADKVRPFLSNSCSSNFSVIPNSFISAVTTPNSSATSTVGQQHPPKSCSISTGHSNFIPTDIPDSYNDGLKNINSTKKRRHSYSSSCGSDDNLSDCHLNHDFSQTVDRNTKHSTSKPCPSHLHPTPQSPSTTPQQTTPLTACVLARSDPEDSRAISRVLTTQTQPLPLLHNSKSEMLLRPIDDDRRQSYLQRSKTFPLSAPRYRLRDPATEFLRTIQDPASQRLTWYKPPLSVLVVKKVRDAMVIPPFLELVTWLTQEKRMVVFVEASVLNDRLVTGHAKFPAVKDKLMSFRETHDDLTDKIDFIICLGGDGTLLYASSLFQQSVPPVMAFHLGSLGFLTPFKFNNYQDQVTNVLEGHAALTLRSRLRCIILRRGQEKQLPPSHHPPLPSTFNSAQTAPAADDKTSQTTNSSGDTQKAPTNLLVLNEVVIDRGPSPYLSNLDLYLDGKRITSVQGDGLIVSTPTGSTAYAVAAGASMIHPSVPAIMVTPICPHSLSFRPIVVPAGVELKITVSKDSRNTAWVSFDGRMRQELKHDDSLRVTTSIYPVPSICAEDQIADWFASLDECLRWNDRKRQRHLDDVVENDDTNDTNDSESSSPNASLPTTPTTMVEKEAAGGLQRVLEKGETVEDEEEEELGPEA